MTAKKPTTEIAQAVKASAVPKRQVIQHTELLKANLTAELRKAQGNLQHADMSLTLAAEERDDAINLANQKYDAIRSEVDAERNDIIKSIEAMESALSVISPRPSNVVDMGDAA